MTVVKMLSNTNTENILSKGKKPYKSWLKDGVNHGPSSMDVLVSWLAHKPNYKKWKREDYSIDRVPKKQLLEEIIDKLRQVGIYHRLAKDVASKISTLQSNYRSTRKWKETEAIKLRLDSRNIRDELLKRFPYWDALHPVFGCRGSSMKFNNELHEKIQHVSSDSIIRLVARHKLKEEKKMEQSRNMLYFLREKRRKKIAHERQLLQQEITNTKLHFMECLNEAGFTEAESASFLDQQK